MIRDTAAPRQPLDPGVLIVAHVLLDDGRSRTTGRTLPWFVQLVGTSADELHERMWAAIQSLRP